MKVQEIFNGTTIDRENDFPVKRKRSPRPADVRDDGWQIEEKDDDAE